MSSDTFHLDPALVKLELLRDGFKITGGFTVPPFIDLILPRGVWASLARENLNGRRARFELVREQEFFYLVDGSDRVHVEVRRNPDFYDSTTSSGKPFGRIASVRANYLEVHPDTLEPQSGISTGDVLEVAQKTTRGGWAEYVGFSTTLVSGEEALTKALPYIGAVRRHVETHISLTTRLPKDAACVDQAYGAGVDAVAYNVDRPAALEHSLEIFRHAASVFLTGSVATCLPLDQEYKSMLPEFIDRLTQNGVFPILTYRMTSGAEQLIEASETAKLLRRVAVSIRRSKFKMGLVPHDLVVVESVDPAFFLAGAGGSVMRKIMRTIAGSRLAFRMGAIRRKLRVRAGRRSS